MFDYIFIIYEFKYVVQHLERYFLLTTIKLGKRKIKHSSSRKLGTYFKEKNRNKSMEM
jgi:hypothetical protein